MLLRKEDVQRISHLIVRVLSVFAIPVLLLAYVGSAQAATIAHWRFEPGNLTADDSGNGNVLLSTGVTSSVDISPVAMGTGSASFNGSQTQFSTASSLDLSGETQLTFEWFLKSSDTAVKFAFEHSPDQNSNAGAFTAQLNPGFGSAGAVGFTNRVSGSGYYRDTTPAISGGLNDWHHYAVQIDSSINNAGASDRIKMYVDGIFVSTDNDSSSPTTTAIPFLDDFFFIGSRNNASLKFVGLLDEMRISSGLLDPSEFLNVVPPVPEPATGLLAFLGCCALKLRRRWAQ